MKYFRFCMFAIGMLLSSAACSPDNSSMDLSTMLEKVFSTGPESGSEVPWPTNAWQTSTPEEQGIYSRYLSDMYLRFRDEKFAISSILIVRHGYLVAEGYYYPYFPEYSQNLYSATKSVISALIGIAIRDGYIQGIDQPVMDFFPNYVPANWSDKKQQMRLYHLLTMTSGLSWREVAPLAGDSLENMWKSADWVNYILDLPMDRDPGILFNYSSGVSHLLSAILRKTTGRNPLAYAQEKLFRPLGISNVTWFVDPQGIPFGGSGIRMTSRDMAKIGLLYLKNGVWEGVQIVPADWVAMSTTSQVRVTSGTMSGWGYGFQWWIIPGLPYDAFEARGHLGQHIIVLPGLDLVVVMTSHDETYQIPINMLADNILPAVEPAGSLAPDAEGAALLQSTLKDIASHQ